MKKILLLTLIILFTCVQNISSENILSRITYDECTYEEIICDESGCTKYIYYCDGRLKQVIPDWD
ncbi:MAG: hypothetical protein WAT71_00655 [Ignavibacteria bacterium]